MNIKGHNKGFTIIELIVAVAILGMMISIIGSFQKDIFYLSSVARSSLLSAQDARNVVRVMAKEMRGMSQGNNGAYPLLQAATSSVKFYSDTDSDGLREEIRYYISGSKLLRGSIKPTGSPATTYTSSNEVVTTLVNDVRNGTSTPVFEYYDSSYAGTTTPMTYPVSLLSVRLIKASISVDADPGRAPIQKIYTSQTALRNLKDNL
ncbi:MAG: type II secretion system protein [Patescibacteria group bacterium]